MPRPVPPMEIRFDREQEVPILCRSCRVCLVKHAISEPGLVHSDLSKYWVAEVLQELYTEAAGQAGELGEQMDATLQTFRKFGSLLLHQLGTCCVRDKHGKLSVVVDKFCEAVLMLGLKNTGYNFQTVPKIAFEHKAFNKVVIETGMFTNEIVQLFKGEEAKLSVEIDRSAVGQGNLVFFLPGAAAKNKFEVFAELVKAGDDVKGLELVEMPTGNSELACWYKLMPFCQWLPWLSPREVAPGRLLTCFTFATSFWYCIRYALAA